MYLLDADVFIQAKNLHYGFDFCPAFWDWIDWAHEAGVVASVEQVGDELRAGHDDLSEWASQRSAFFLPPDSLTVPSLRLAASWATGADYTPAAVSTFLQVADQYLVAQAHAHAHTVVTHERADGSRRRIKIPEACLGLGVKCVTPFQMLRTEQARFIFPPTPSAARLF